MGVQARVEGSYPPPCLIVMTLPCLTTSLSPAGSFTQAEALARSLRTATAATVAAAVGLGSRGAPPCHGGRFPPLELALLLAPEERLFCREEFLLFGVLSMAGALKTMEAELQALVAAHSGGGLNVSLRVGHVV